MTQRASLHARLSYALAWIRGRIDTTPTVGVILGSALGRFAARLADAAVIPYEEIPEFPVSRVVGHAGRLVIGDLPGAAGPVTVAALDGRVHGYEGWSPEDVAFGARVLCQLGCRFVVVTNASGGVNPDFGPGDLVRIEDHLNLSGQNPLTGRNDERLGPRFPDMTHAYDPSLGARLDATAARLGIPLKHGVYACLPGPSYETPAEIRMLRALGADLVGMSTVPDVIVAVHSGMKVVGFSIVTDQCLPDALEPASLEQILAVAGRAEPHLTRLVAALVPQID